MNMPYLIMLITKKILKIFGRPPPSPQNSCSYWPNFDFPPTPLLQTSFSDYDKNSNFLIVPLQLKGEKLYTYEPQAQENIWYSL